MSAAIVGSVIGGVGALVLIGWPALTYYFVDYSCERPKYTLVKQLSKKAQVRRYAPYLVAEVTIQNEPMRGALSSGFRKVAKYIFGGNTTKESAKSSEKIAMTAPVASTRGEDGHYRVNFMMPSKYTAVSQLPKPNDEEVKLREVPSRNLAALSWRGRVPSEQKVEQKRAELIAVLKRAGIEIANSNEQTLWQYHPPFAPFFMRQNEVLLPVKLD